MREHRITKIIHFATPKVGNVNSSLGSSLVMLKNVLDVCANNKISLCLMSRWEVFGGYKGKNLIVDENYPHNPEGVLGYTKYLMEKLALQYSARKNIELLLLRSSLVFGDGSAPNFINSFIRKARENSQIITHDYRNGYPQIDLINSKDWSKGFWRILKSKTTGILNLGCGSSLDTNEIANIVINTLKSKSDICSVKIDDNSANIILNPNRMYETLNWKPEYNNRNMLADYVLSFNE